MSEVKVDERLSEVLPKIRNLRAIVRFDLGGDGVWMIDAREGPARLSEGEGDDDPDCSILISGENLLKLMDGKLDPMLAYTLGKIKVKGSMGVAMKLVAAIG
ncbi:SCP2 sterol-binding domain-containing protein [Telmatospirillum siberiense]|uniref:Sterol-binding protein n=1 Tax=Telmatospirillum siberiense TaxID=382514 RepID=A0A2N3PYE0_9PROT|nr:SCP2 sterol-binding domain-containing protein [Telmatospirillum siberiense]PKU25427.1 sterol-binding protein [Telmatospirillum siberiense]